MSRPVTRALIVAAAVVVAILSTRIPAEAPPDAPGPLPPQSARGATVSHRPLSAERVASPEVVEITASGREEAVVDRDEEDLVAAARYADRIEENIRHLEAAAAAARAEGNAVRAELMEKRIRGLLRRLEEHGSGRG